MVPQPFPQTPIHAAPWLAILRRMRYEGWTVRAAEVRLGEHRAWRQVPPLSSVPDHTTWYRFRQRLDDQLIDWAVGETGRRLCGTPKKKRRRAGVGVDATGLAQGAVNTFLVRRLHPHGHTELAWRHWLKGVIVADRDEPFLLSQMARHGPWNDGANWPAVVGAGSPETPLGGVLADGEFDSESNHTYIRGELGARSVIPAKRGMKTWRLHGVRAEIRRAFPQRIYRRGAYRKRLLLGQAPGLDSGARPQLAQAEASSPATRPEGQSVSPQASIHILEDVNRAR